MFEAYSHSNHEGLIAASCIEKEVRFGSFATEIACPRRVRFYPDSGLNDETRARLVAACWRFAAVSYVTSYPPETP